MKESNRGRPADVIIDAEMARLRVKLRRRSRRTPSQEGLSAARRELGPSPSVVEAVTDWRRTKAEGGRADRPTS